MHDATTDTPASFQLQVHRQCPFIRLQRLMIEKNNWAPNILGNVLEKENDNNENVKKKC